MRKFVEKWRFTILFLLFIIVPQVLGYLQPKHAEDWIRISTIVLSLVLIGSFFFFFKKPFEKWLVPLSVVIGVCGPILILLVFPESKNWPDPWVLVWLLSWVWLGLGLYHWLFESVIPRYEQRLELRQLVIFRNSSPLKITRNGKIVEIAIVNATDQKVLSVRDLDKPDYVPWTDGSLLRHIALSGGDVLNVCKHKKGFMISWNKGENPWVVV